MGNSMRMATRCTLAWLPSRSRTTTTARPPHSSPASITTLASPSSTPRPSATLSVTCAKWSKLRTTALIWDTPWRRRKRKRRKKLPKFARRSLKRAVHSDATPTLTSAQEPASPTLLRASTFQKLALPTARSRWSAMKNLWTVKAILCTHGTLSGSRPKEQAPAPRSGLLSWLLARLRLEFLPASTTERCHLQARAARDLPGKAEPWLKECARGGEAACARGVTVRESTMLNSIRNHNVLKGGGVGIWSLG